jgi:quercetin dioxygenase-like cupin family protein
MTKPRDRASDYDHTDSADGRRRARVHFRPADSAIPSVVGPFTVRTLVSGAETDGTLSVIEYRAAQDAPAEEPHALSIEDVAIIMLHGAATFEADDRLFALTAGASLYVGRGVPMRRISVDSDETMYLIVFLPGGMDQFFVDTAQLINRRLAAGITMEEIMPEIRDMQSKYGIV